MTTVYEQTQSFAKEHVAPYAKTYDEEARFPSESFEALAAQGYLTLLIPEEFGGQGKDLTEHTQAIMALAEQAASVGLCYMMHNVCISLVRNYGSEELKKEIFTDVIKNNAVMALAYSEFGTGTHFYMPETTASKEGTVTTLTGKKSMVTSAEYAKYYLVLAPSQEEGKINNWILTLNQDGLSFGINQWNGIGMRSNVSAPMTMDGVKLDEFYRIGEEGSAQDQVFQTVAIYFIEGLAAVYSGLNIALITAAIDHTTSRKYPDGSSLASIETVQVHLADIYAMANSSKDATNAAAESYSKGDADAVAKIIAARITASENVIESARIAMRVGGGKSYNKATPIERYLRDAYASQIMAPSVDVLKLWLARAVTGQPLL